MKDAQGEVQALNTTSMGPDGMRAEECCYGFLLFIIFQKAVLEQRRKWCPVVSGVPFLWLLEEGVLEEKVKGA